MSHIDITRTHNLSIDQVRGLMEQLAADLAAKYGAKYEYTDRGLTYKGPGVEGDFEILEGAIRITAKLGLLMRPMKSMLEGQIHQEIERLVSEYDTPTTSKSSKSKKG